VKKALFFIWIVAPSFGYSVQTKMYPTAATVQIRMDTYMDAIATIYNSTSTDSVDLINKIVDADVEEYLVFPSSYVPVDSQPWAGWCEQNINGKLIPSVCSQ
jgi:hypothetical protein